MEQPDPQRVVRMLGNARGVVARGYLLNRDARGARALLEEVAVLDYLLEEVEADGKSRIVRMMESEQTYYSSS